MNALRHFRLFCMLQQESLLPSNPVIVPGMSTIPEVLVAAHCGIRVFAFSLITNECILEEDSEEMANHEEVIATANEQKEMLMDFVGRMVEGIRDIRKEEEAEKEKGAKDKS